MDKPRINGPVHPAGLMVAFWLFICVVYFWGPIHLTPEVSFSTYLFLALHIVFYILGSTVFLQISFFRKSASKASYLSYLPLHHVHNLIFVVLFIGVAGGVISIFCKLSSLEVINFSSIAQLRTLRAQVLLDGGGLQSGYMSAIAFLTYPAGFVGIVATIICYEKIPLISRIMSFLFLIIIVFLALCAGGRSPIMVLFLFIGTSCYVRKKIGKTYTPKSVPLRLTVVSLMILFVIYSSFIWVIRSKEAGLSSDAMINHAEHVWGAHPKDGLLAMSEFLNKPGLTQTVLSSTFYFIQNLSISERLLSSTEDIPAMYGAYQIDLFAAVLRAIPGGGEFLKQGYGKLLNANVYGFFTGAWTGLYIDLGFFSLLAALIWGYFSGKSWLNFKRNPTVLSGITYIFWIYSIFISFVSSPFGFSNSLMIFLWFIFFSLACLLFTRYKAIHKGSA
ncbi:O-antigen polymerase [Legionella antarctica]|nr:O-antigen polymerase [Legionella antarctica]